MRLNLSKRVLLRWAAMGAVAARTWRRQAGRMRPRPMKRLMPCGQPLEILLESPDEQCRCVKQKGRKHESLRPFDVWSSGDGSLACLGQRLVEIGGNLVEEAFGRKPLLFRADEKGEVLRHVAAFHR